MSLKTENFFKIRVINSRISIFLATTFSVLIMGVLGLVAINYNTLETNLKENVSFNLIIEESIEEIQIQQLIKSLILMPNVKSVDFISREESANLLANNLGQDFLKVLGGNPLSNIIEVRFFSDFLIRTTSQSQINEFMYYSEVKEVIYDENLIALLEKNFTRLGVLLLFMAILFFIIAFALINSNIRLTIYSKRFNIKTMQLVGATKKFIQKPFLISNLKSTILACLVGNLILMVFLSLAIDKFPELKNMFSIYQLIYLTFAICGINLLISFFSTWIFVRKYLNLNTEDLYK
ncbi:MAG: FtsX-like permease family protein [Flavobacteriales bacterium TMED191]|nr:MAG: FtsX-like permease family protein [Flavobacteriales bacterium TMED191]|tara:strand:+ start:256 stop:1134 length:879 start_codon:yes stop_codon:yes gene_type:complete